MEVPEPEPDWSSLPSDLVNRVGDYLLSTNDIDYYMGMRAVCHNWRSATADPRRAGADLLRFRPRRWVMIEEEPKEDGDDTRLFVNVTTGRFLRRPLPLLRDYILVATSDGLLVLGQSKLPFLMRVLNPFTGSMIHFVTSMPYDRVMSAVTGSDPALVFSFDVRHGEKVCCANPASTLFGAQHFPRGKSKVASIVAYAGHVYMVDKEGLVVNSNGTVIHRYDGKMLADMTDVVACPWEPHEAYTHKSNFFLVESAGELMLVRREPWRGAKVFRVDVDLGALVPVKSIGTRALFLGYRCVSVDANKFPSVDGDSVYYADDEMQTFRVSTMYRLDLRSGKEENISSLLVPRCDSLRVCPFSFVQALLNYCVTLPDVQPLLRRSLTTVYLPGITLVDGIVYEW